MRRPLVPTLIAIAIGAMAALPAAMAQTEPAGSGYDEDEGKSNQPMGDAWITAKVKTELLAAKDVSGLKIDVDTVDGVVKLSGTVNDQAQADKAKAVAKSVQGVQSVDTSALKVEAAAD